MWRDCVLSEPQRLKTPHWRPVLLRFVEFRVCESSGTQAFVAQLVQLVRPETPPTQMKNCENTVAGKNCSWVRSKPARPAVLKAAADMYVNSRNRDKIPELTHALAEDQFQLFSGVQGATMLGACTHTHTCELAFLLRTFRRVYRQAIINLKLVEQTCLKLSLFMLRISIKKFVTFDGQFWNPEAADFSWRREHLSICGGLATLEQWPTCLRAG